MDAIKYFEEKKRMMNSLGRKNGICSGVNCNDCPFNLCTDKKGMLCGEIEFEYPEEAVAIVEKWAEEHPQKTMLMDFLEKYPKIKLASDGTPRSICPSDLGYEDQYCELVNRDCVACWNRPLEE